MLCDVENRIPFPFYVLDVEKLYGDSLHWN